MIDYITRDIEEITYDFFIATGVNLQIRDASFNKLNYISYTFSKKYCQIIQSTKTGHRLCVESDQKLLNQCKETKEATFHICPAGLIDLAVPIINENTIIGYILLGQIKHKNEFCLNESFFEKTEVDVSSLKKEYENLVLFDNAKIKSIINLATLLAKYFLTEKIIKHKHIPTLQTVIDFIDANLEKTLTISYIEKQTYISKSSLYSLFHENFHCTIKEYVNKRRIERACHMLLYSNQSIEYISEFVGFSSGPYFSKVFKNIMKMSPIQYKKTQDNNYKWGGKR
ncbi:MAG: PocR ligand-binding domain-containing protein [Clostridia bacterium]|nr:PocR ligand-binding domain-containing protein [Clostridia bacterium]MBQ8657751.1 PocR ligand-binding domain-containing protein [Clostridia bacterium]